MRKARNLSPNIILWNTQKMRRQVAHIATQSEKKTGLEKPFWKIRAAETCMPQSAATWKELLQRILYSLNYTDTSRGLPCQFMHRDLNYIVTISALIWHWNHLAAIEHIHFKYMHLKSFEKHYIIGLKLASVKCWRCKCDLCVLMILLGNGTFCYEKKNTGERWCCVYSPHQEDEPHKQDARSAQLIKLYNWCTTPPLYRPYARIINQHSARMHCSDTWIFMMKSTASNGICNTDPDIKKLMNLLLLVGSLIQSGG